MLQDSEKIKQFEEKFPGIKYLGAGKKKILLSKNKEVVDNITGEIILSEEFKVEQVQTKDEFTKLFVENIDYLGNKLEDSEFKIFFYVVKRIDYNNIITIDSSFRKNVSKMYDISTSTVSRSIKGLIAKGVLLPMSEEMKEKYGMWAGDSYLINPNIIGKGSFRDVKHLRQIVVNDFDFEQFKISKTATVLAQYDGGEKLISAPHDYDIREISISKDEKNNYVDGNIVVSKKEEYDHDLKNSIMIENQEVDNKENINKENDMKTLLELEALKTKNLELELKKQELELKQKLLDSGKIDELLGILGK
ncbi:hypothetical protein [Campylobacter sp. US33a]|uniref:hypothetical protein n=1 Tax=Campylobacter sp. US33a TaxID=2498120 RepID=UPI001068009B|nr:hypothetical protein [Campylobacter sp. US33a]TEX99681.1 hypothetical protein ELQ16_09675 [Campylobacter sp. US33a]